MAEDLDLSVLDDLDDGPSDEQLNTITQLAKAQVAAELNIEQLEEQLRKAKLNLQRIMWNLLPDAMQAAGVKEFTLQDGKKIIIKDEVYASISEANRPAALAWLRDHNHGSIIKNAFQVMVRGGEPLEKDVVKFLEEHEVEYDQKQSVHNRTLQSWVKQQLADGHEVPESISYHEQRVSKVVK